MDSTVAALQSAINRFAAVGGFPKVDVDGIWGPKTKQGVYSALSWIGQGKCYQNACADDNTAKAAAGIMAQWDESVGAVKGLSEFIAGIANDLGIPHVAAPIPGTPQVPGGQLPSSPYDIASAGILESFKRLPMWQQILIGVLGSAGVLWAANRVAKAKRA